VGPRAVLDAVVNRKIPSPRRESNPDHPIVQPVSSLYTILAHRRWVYNIKIDFKGTGFESECMDSLLLWIGPVAGCCEPSGTNKVRKFLDPLGNCQRFSRKTLHRG
jgi:hypothetical protein